LFIVYNAIFFVTLILQIYYSRPIGVLMNRSNLVWFASTFFCGLLYAGDATKDCGVREARTPAVVTRTAAVASLSMPPKSPTRPDVRARHNSVPSGTMVCCGAKCGYYSAEQPKTPVDYSRPYWAEFPGQGYMPQ
jgi:hypothetical protein